MHFRIPLKSNKKLLQAACPKPTWQTAACRSVLQSLLTSPAEPPMPSQRALNAAHWCAGSGFPAPWHHTRDEGQLDPASRREPSQNPAMLGADGTDCGSKPLVRELPMGCECELRVIFVATATDYEAHSILKGTLSEIIPSAPASGVGAVVVVHSAMRTALTCTTCATVSKSADASRPPTPAQSDSASCLEKASLSLTSRSKRTLFTHAVCLANASIDT